MLSSPRGMGSYLWHQRVLLKDFAEHVHKVSTGLKDAVVQAVRDTGRPVIHLRTSNERKDLQAREIAERDGITQGPVCLFTVVEPCSSFEVGPNRATKR